ncbi:CLIP-associating protein 1-like isoform X8 [Portunus trituberculatus]|uniref:CLIP-associating protein 1-like isoform X8 n=1 Tax=Portunus trituberculatus TaxID=210409 RepID=UPI001E1CC041|nr:CLIP-associating protein 1-like isoform X8 [Portunus trituberculatus]
MSQLDLFTPQLSTTDTRKKIALGTEIINYLGVPTNSFDCDDIGHFIDGLVPWLQSSNFKVALNGLEVMTFLVERMSHDFRPYLSSVIPAATDRLGDSKDAVREKAQMLLSSMMENVVSPNSMFERLIPAFSHKNGKVREEVMNCLQNTLNNHGASSVTVSRLVPHIVKLLSDPTALVRDCAFSTLVECYKHYGERLRIDLSKKHNVPPSKLPALMTRFDEVRDTGLMLPSATTASGYTEGKGDDDVDRASVKSGGSKSRASSAPPVRRTVQGAALPPKSAGAAAGAVDEASFFALFEDVPKVTIYSHKELEDTLTKVREVIASSSNDWDKRVDALKKIRSLIIAGAASYEEFYPHLRLLEPAMQLSIKDLRSQVVREACVTVAYMSQELHHKVDHLCETLLPSLIILIPNSAKIMASSGIVTIRFIIQNTHHHKLIPILLRELSSKNREIRKVLCEVLDQLVHTWPTHSMEKHIVILSESIKKGITDADPEARAFSRK